MVESSAASPVGPMKEHEASSPEEEKDPQQQQQQQPSALMAYAYMFQWIAMSSVVILFNKYILAVSGFEYPIALTTLHMGFCSAVCFGLVKTGALEVAPIPSDVYWRAVVPIGALFSLVLAAGNWAYLYLSVSFIQMLKASQPVVVFLVGHTLGTEKYSLTSLINVLVIGVGVMISTYGEINFVAVGVAFQVFSIVAEAVRITLIQIMLQKRGVKLNPISTLYYVAPCCFIFLLLPLLIFEAGPLIQSSLNCWELIPMLLLNSLAAFCLNLTVFMLIGKTSALTMNIAGVVKDWLLILLSVIIFKSIVTGTNLFGYCIAFCGVVWYNYRRNQKK